MRNIGTLLATPYRKSVWDVGLNFWIVGLYNASIDALLLNEETAFDGFTGILLYFLCLVHICAKCESSCVVAELSRPIPDTLGQETRMCFSTSAGHSKKWTLVFTTERLKSLFAAYADDGHVFITHQHSSLILLMKDCYVQQLVRHFWLGYSHHGNIARVHPCLSSSRRRYCNALLCVPPKSDWQVPEGSGTWHRFENHSFGSPFVSAWILSFFSLLELSKQSWAFSFIRSAFKVLRYEDSEVLWLTPSGHSKNKDKTPQWSIFLLLRPTAVERSAGEPQETVDAFKSRLKTHPFNSAFKWFSLHSS